MTKTKFNLTMNTLQTKNNQKYPQKDSNLHAIFRGDICIHYIMRAFITSY